MAQRAEGAGAQSRVRRSEGPESREQGAGGQVSAVQTLCWGGRGEREREPWTWQGAACGHGREGGDVGSENQRPKGEGGHVWVRQARVSLQRCCEGLV